MTKGQARKIKERMLKALDTLSKDELSKNRGKVIQTNSPISKKVRRHKARKYPKQFYPLKFLEKNLIIEQEPYYDDWVYKDGFRDILGGNKLIKRYNSYYKEAVEETNKKIKKQIKIRKAKHL